MNERSGPKRLWFPVGGTMLIVASCIGFIKFVAQGDDWNASHHTIAIMFSGMAVFLLLLVWILFLSGLRWWVRLLIPIVAIGGTILAFQQTVREIHYDGDVSSPRITWKWDPTREEIRQKHAAAAKPATFSVTPTPNDYLEYRGPARDGVVGSKLVGNYVKKWQQPCGEGYAGMCIVGDALITIDQRGESEAVVAHHVDTGAELWVHQYSTRFSEALGGDGPRTTPTYKDGMIYALGAGGKLTCLDAATGKKVWDTEILTDKGNIIWGMSGSPLVDDKLVIVNPGAQNDAGKGRAMMAFDRKTGSEVWRAGDTTAGYSSPMFATIAGVRQVVILDGVEVAGYDATNGKKLWQHPFVNGQKINVAQPLILGDDRVFASHSYGGGSEMLQLKYDGTNWAVKSLWKTKKMKCKFTSPVEYQGYIYGLDEGILACIDAKDGTQKWKGDRYGHGQVLLAGNAIGVFAETGFFAVVAADPNKFTEIQRTAIFNDPKNWNPFTLAGQRLFVRNHQEMARYDIVEAGK